MGSLPLSQAAVDLGLRDQIKGEMDEELKKKKKPDDQQKTPLQSIMSPAASMLFGGTGY